jgi:hypothetical protein
MTSRRRATQEIHDERRPATHPLHLRELHGSVLPLRLPDPRPAGRGPARHPGRLRLRLVVPLRRGLHLPEGLTVRRPMDSFALAFIGGIVGAVLMDVTEAAMARVGIGSGVQVALVGRWVLGLARGRLAHADIRASPALPHEAGVGWAFHFLIGGGGVALLYPGARLVMGLPASDDPVLGGLVFGLVTSLLPWLVLLPAFGWGWFGRRGPPGAHALLASPLSHIPYGLGLGVVMALGTGYPWAALGGGSPWP